MAPAGIGGLYPSTHCPPDTLGGACIETGLFPLVSDVSTGRAGGSGLDDPAAPPLPSPSPPPKPRLLPPLTTLEEACSNRRRMASFSCSADRQPAAPDPEPVADPLSGVEGPAGAGDIGGGVTATGVAVLGVSVMLLPNDGGAFAPFVKGGDTGQPFELPSAFDDSWRGGKT